MGSSRVEQNWAFRWWHIAMASRWSIRWRAQPLPTGRRKSQRAPSSTTSPWAREMSTLVHQEVDRGAFGYDTPVVELWPEFGDHGKESVTVRHVLTHTAGLPGIPLDSTTSDISTWDTMIHALENAELWWEPGTKIGYHAYTFGYLARSEER